jgi:iron complex outermembrane receptor protein
MPERERLDHETAYFQVMLALLPPGRTRYLLALSLLWLSSYASAQYYILGRGLDDQEQPYAHATAELRGKDYFTQQTCTDRGVFRFENLKAGSYELVLITTYGMRRKKIELRGSIDITLHVPRNIKIDEISVVANKAGDKEPVTHDNMTAAEIQKKDFGQDMPYILEGTPSLVTTSDAGQGIGYTGMRIRGTDPTRINVTLNGIPVNDAESHNVFWVDLPDLASSTTNIQIQRGLGWSQPGTGDLGAGVHINTLGFHYEPYALLKLSGGSFNTRRATLSGGTGLLNGRYTFDGRASYLSSDGYIDRASSKLYSVYGAAGYHHDETHIRLMYAYGNELTYQAWNGVPEQYVNDPELRTYNSAGTEKPGTPYDNEVDDYQQGHLQLHLDQAVTPFARWNTALFLTHGKGYFEQYKADQQLEDYGISGYPEPSDLVRQRWLDNNYYGFTSSLHIGTPGERYFVAGGAWTRYQGQHFGEIIWTENEAPDDYADSYYDNDALKTDWNVFARSNNKITDQFDLTVDLQGRWIRYSFEGPDPQGVLTDQEVSLKFFNPKIGLRYTLSESVSLYGLTGLVHKEPNRDDYTQSTPLSRPDAEQLWDTEIGLRHQKGKLSLEMTGYAMMYKDQLVPTGQLNDVGAYTRVNVDKSHRLGVELNLGFNPLKDLQLTAYGTFSQNRINAFTEYIDNWADGTQQAVEHQNTHLAFSPELISGIRASYTLISTTKDELTFDLSGMYVGKQYVDNTSRDASLLDAYFTTDVGIRWRLFNRLGKEIGLSVLARNILDESYESNGWIYRFSSPGYNPVPDDPYAGNEGGDLYHQKGYFPQAGRYFLVNLDFRF